MKLYYPKSHYDKSSRGQVFPLLKPFIKGDDFTDAQRMKQYYVSEKDFEFIDNIEEAEFVILTMAWNYYVKNNKTDKAISFVNECDKKGKRVLTWNSGDHGVRIPILSNLIVVRQSGYHSKFSPNEFSLPAFIGDPLKKYYNTDKPYIIPYSPKPLIGFCGQAQLSRTRAVKELFNILRRNLKYHSRLTSAEPEELLPTTYLRASILDRLKKSDLVDTKFILREKYRAGVTKNKDSHSTTLEFYDNLKISPYIVCVRGGGNFSVRFYEAMAMGRIPVFINTDCSLPFYDDVDWKKHVVWVEYKERHQVAQKVKDFHEGLSERDFIDLQLANRKLWEERLTLGGFFKNWLNTVY